MGSSKRRWACFLQTRKLDEHQRFDPSCTSAQRCSYHVFLSFRGIDTRTGFTDHLYTALNREGFHTFRDDDEINKGEYISLEIRQAIQESKISIIVLSDFYANSTWCLDGLVTIMEQRRSGGQIVMPVFYHLTVSQVKQQSGSFGEAFAVHEERHSDKVEEWRKSLREVAELAGFVLQDGYESGLIERIVEEVGKKLRCQLLNVPFHLVGRESIIRHINSWVQEGSDDASIAVLCGMGGIGKTTIAKVAFNMNLNNFEGRSFIADVREVSNQPNGLVRLQRQFLSDLLRNKAEKINSVHEGIIRIKDVVCCRKVLLVVDDVDDLEQFHAIVQSKEWFCAGSKIIVTTRNDSSLRSEDVDAVFRMEELDDEKSLQLLSWHAFGQDHPKESFEEHSINMVKHCAGLPLALQVLGSSLVGKSLKVWECALQKLKMVMNEKVQGILRVSYDSLQDDYDRELLLDIACFFIGMDIDYVVTILQASHSFPIVGLQNLMDRCLVITNDKNKLKMHGLIRGMAREIDHQRSQEDSRRHSRLWSNEDFIHVLRENKDTESITGVSLKFLKTMEESYPSDRLMLQFRQKCRRISFFNHKSVQTSQTKSFSTEAFRNMKKLRFLHLSNVNLTGCYDDFSKSLSWLRWDGFHSCAIPSALCQQNLVVLDMQHSNLEYCWKGIKFIGELKILNLSHSHALFRTPNFRGLPSLQRLILKGCINLVEIDESIVDLQRLAVLNLKNCKSLKVLPSRINMLKSLQNINLSGCINLSEPPEVKQAFSCNRGLKKLISLPPLRSVFLYRLFPRRGAQLPRFPLSFLPRNLVSLSLAGCNISDSAIPMDLSCFYFLRHLDLSRNPICSLPEGLMNLSMLESLNVSSCDNLRTIPALPASLETLWAMFCKSLVRVGNFANAISSGESVKIGLYGSEKLVEIEGWFKLEPTSNNHREILRSLGLPNLESVENVEVVVVSSYGYRRVTAVQGPLLHQYGISSMFLPGDEVPKWFSHQNKGALLSFVVPAAANAKMLGFGLCIAYALDAWKPYRLLFVEIRNKTKGLKWPFRPQLYGVPDTNHELMLWLSLWIFKENEFEAGDEIQVSTHLSFSVIVKGIGIRLIDQHEDLSDGTERLCVWNEESIIKVDPFAKLLYILQSAPEAEQSVIFSEFERLYRLWEVNFGYSKEDDLHRIIEIKDRLTKCITKIASGSADLMILSKFWDDKGEIGDSALLHPLLKDHK